MPLTFILTAVIVGVLIIAGILKWMETEHPVKPEPETKHKKNLECVLNFAKIHGHVSLLDVQRELGVADITASHYVKELVDEGLLVFEGEWDRYACYKPAGDNFSGSEEQQNNKF